MNTLAVISITRSPSPWRRIAGLFALFAFIFGPNSITAPLNVAAGSECPAEDGERGEETNLQESVAVSQSEHAGRRHRVVAFSQAIPPIRVATVTMPPAAVGHRIANGLLAPLRT